VSWSRIAPETITAEVNSILLSPQFPTKNDLLVLLSNRLLIARDGGQAWSQWGTELSLAESLTAVAAPQGLDPGAPLLVGLVDGRVLQI
jgi:hypothetical protein